MGTKNNATFINILSSIDPGFASVGSPASEVTSPARKIPTPDTAFAEKPCAEKKMPSERFLVVSSESSTISDTMDETKIVTATPVETSIK